MVMQARQAVRVLLYKAAQRDIHKANAAVRAHIAVRDGSTQWHMKFKELQRERDDAITHAESIRAEIIANG